MEEKIKIRPTLYEMKVGDSISFPILRLKSVRTQASELGMMFERQYKTRIDRATRTIEVERVQ